jgi:hypothetical protein
MTARYYTCDACNAAKASFFWRWPEPLRELARLAPAARSVTRPCEHVVLVMGSGLTWVGPSAEWRDALLRADIDAAALAGANEPRAPTERPDEQTAESLATLAALATRDERELTYARLDGPGLTIAVTAPGLRWVGYRRDWQAARLPHLRAALARAS